jgi:hypothetical protein
MALRIFGSVAGHVRRSGTGEAHTANQVAFDRTNVTYGEGEENGPFPWDNNPNVQVAIERLLDIVQSQSESIISLQSAVSALQNAVNALLDQGD